MADVNGKSSGSGPDYQASGSGLVEASRRVLENLAELEPELVNAGIFDGDLEAVAVTSDSPEWPKQATALLKSLDAASGDEVFDSAHVAGTDGEVFAVTENGLSLVAVTGRFVLASLSSYDMRMALRDATRSANANIDGKPLGKAENQGADDA